MTNDPTLETFRQEVRNFLHTQLPEPLRQSVLQHRRLGKQDFLDWLAILNRRGWAAPGWPVAYGGTGWSVMQRHIFDEENALAGAPEVPPFGVRMIAPVLMKFGTDRQRARYLPRILSGEDWWCQGYSEPGAGSDLASLQTRAEVQGDHFVVTGQKTWTTYGQYANRMFCLVRTDPAAQKQRGISFLLIDMDSPGVTVRPIQTLDGDHEINEVFLDEVKVPLTNLVGELNQGWTCAKYLLSHERTGAARVGRAKREMAFLKDVAAQRVVDGQRLIDDPVFARDLARVEIDLLALEHTALRMLDLIDAGAGHGAEASILKFMGTSVAQAITGLSTQALGPHLLPYEAAAFAPFTRPEEAAAPRGSASSPDWAGAVAGFHLNLRKISIYGGTDEVQKNIIAKTALGL